MNMHNYMQCHVIADSQVIATYVGTTVGVLLFLIISTAIIVVSLIIYKKRKGNTV